MSGINKLLDKINMRKEHLTEQIKNEGDGERERFNKKSNKKQFPNSEVAPVAACSTSRNLAADSAFWKGARGFVPLLHGICPVGN